MFDGVSGGTYTLLFIVGLDDDHPKHNDNRGLYKCKQLTISVTLFAFSISFCSLIYEPFTCSIFFSRPHSNSLTLPFLQCNFEIASRHVSLEV